MYNHNKITVVIPTFNNGPMAIHAIESIFNQTLKPNNLFVVDDGSEDSTYETICKFFGVKKIHVEDKTAWPPRHDFVKNEINITIIRKRHGGQSQTRNLAVFLSINETDIFAFLDSDDKYKKYMLEKSIQVMDEYPSISCVVGDYNEVKNTYINTRQYVSPFDFRRLATSHGYNINCVVRKTSIQKLSYVFDEKLNTREDYDFFVRLSKTGIIYHLPCVLYDKRIHDKQLCRILGKTKIQETESEIRKRLYGLDKK